MLKTFHNWMTFICQLVSAGSEVIDKLCTMSPHLLFKSCHNLKYFFLYENMEALKKKLVLNPKAGFRKIKLFGFACCSSQSHESVLISLFLLSSRKNHLPTEFDLMFTKHNFLRQLSDFQSRIDVCFGVQRKIENLWKIEPQIFSALEIVPRPKLGERFRKYSRAFQPLW